MKRNIIVFIILYCLVLSTFAIGAVITIELNSVPARLQCDTDCLCNKNWAVSDIVMRVTSTITDNACDSDGCKWEHRDNLYGPVFDKGVFLKPGRLILDLDAIDDPIARIRVDLEDYCPETGCSSASIYDGDSQIAIKTSQSDNGPINEPGFFIFDQSVIGNNTIDRLIVSSCNGHVGQIKITTDPLDICELPIDSGPCRGSFPRYGFNTETGKCEKFNYGGCEGNQNNFSSLEECQERCGGTTYSTCVSLGCGTYSTCGSLSCITYSTCSSGFGCSTYSTCGGFGCGTYSTCGIFGCGTYSTCGSFGCGTYSTCSSGFGCGTYSTCGGLGCGTYSTCGIFSCGTYSTCGNFGCGTYSTCSGGFGCGTYSTCGGFGCGTYFTCNGLCSTTSNTCGLFCSITQSTCSILCRFTYDLCPYITGGYSRYRESKTPGPTPAY